jgi:hypothetical protein
MTTNTFSGPLATDLADFAANLEASASANKTMLTQLRALDRFTRETALPTGTIDEPGGYPRRAVMRRRAGCSWTPAPPRRPRSDPTEGQLGV